ncbi:hypothetical protein, partial [Pseudomonas aeruginosa]|uniref:hypothetical protein n=3 Tax=Pseudomonas aeruginosa TaxID=287 RepID=UPI0015880A99
MLIAHELQLHYVTADDLVRTDSLLSDIQQTSMIGLALPTRPEAQRWIAQALLQLPTEPSVTLLEVIGELRSHIHF